METDIKAYDLFWDLYKKNDSFRSVVDSGMSSNMIRFFDDDLWDKIKSQNFISYDDIMKEFVDMFLLGYNIGNCVGASRQLSYSFNDVDIVSGVLPIIKGTLNAEKEGGHCWLDDFGYIEENRITKESLRRSQVYQARKDFVNDNELRRKK